MGKYQAYPEYKDTGIDWLPKVPTCWQVLPVKLVLMNKVKDGPHETPVFIEEGVPFLSVDGIQDGKLVFEGCRYISQEDHERYSKKCLPKYGDILLGKAASVGKVAFVDTEQEFNVWSPLAVLTPKTVKFGRFLYYSLQSTWLQAQCDVSSNSNTQKNLSMGVIDNLLFPIPIDDVAEEISNFLDHETAKIDTLIDKQQQLIQLLKEKHEATVVHAMVKGLDENTPLKNSGVKWLGSIPEHWEVLTTKRFFSLECHPAPNNNDMELLSVYTDIGVRPRKDLEQKGNKASTTDGYWLVKKGDLIVNKLLAWMGAVGYSNYDGVTSPAYDILRKRRPLNVKFYHYLFRSRIAQSEFKRWSRGIMEMRLRLYFDELGRIPMPFPPENEQDEIVDKIESLETQYAGIIAKAYKQIELLRERRTALISAAVTGKIDVRHHACHPTGDLQSSKSTVHGDL